MLNKQELEAELEKRMPAKGLLKYGWDYLEGYKIIKTAKPAMTSLYQIKLFLLCHSLELVTKAYLRHHGYSREKLLNFKHDLISILMEAQKKFNFIIDKTEISYILSVNHYYKTKQFEYIQTGYKEHVGLDDLEKIVIKLANQFTKLIGTR